MIRGRTSRRIITVAVVDIFGAFHIIMVVVVDIFAPRWAFHIIMVAVVDIFAPRWAFLPSGSKVTSPGNA